jgi:NMD protein affecting ribosome stability and mRNA decay
MDKILCYSCSIARNKINAVKSSLIPSINLMLCETCLASGYEPRWAIVIAGRQSGSELVKDYVLNKKYIGEEIVASELLI